MANTHCTTAYNLPSLNFVKYNRDKHAHSYSTSLDSHQNDLMEE